MTSVVLAKALYNNDSEAEDELSFKKDDLITVLETDLEGMTGWWLCSLGDKQGVAPGNRLRLLSTDEIYDTPVKAYKEKYGDVDYDVPKPHQSSEYQDYAIPKSPYGNLPVPDSQRHGFVLPSPHILQPFDARNSNSSDGLVTNEVYDAPSRWSSERSSDEFRFSGEVYQESGPEDMYDVPSRDSMESDDGGLGQQNNSTLNVPAIPPKTRLSSNGYQGNNSGLRESQELYDSPANLTQEINESDVYDQLPSKVDKKLSVLFRSLSNENQIYDTLPNEIYDVPPAVPEDIYDVPPSESSYQSSYQRIDFPADGNNNPPVYCDETSASDLAVADESLYDVPTEKDLPGGVYGNFELAKLEYELKVNEELQAEMARNQSSQRNEPSQGTGSSQSGGKQPKKQSSESDDYVDYAEIYGMGQVERQDTLAGEKPKSECSVMDRINMDKVCELRISHSVAMTNLDKLQQAVDVAVTKLLSFVTEDWRKPEIYALNINGIREISGKVKVALRLLTDFGLGALVNSKQLPDGDTSRKIKEALEPLLETYYSIKSAIQQLDETNWRSAYQMSEDDELNSIANMAQGIPCDAYNLGAVIANAAPFLFDKTADHVCSGPGTDVAVTKTPPGPISSSSPVTVQKESIKGLEASKVVSEPVGIQAKQLVTPKTSEGPPMVSPKPKRNRNSKENGSGPREERSLSDNVSELTNNLLNQIEDMKPSPGLRRKGSKKLSPKTVRRLCSIGLENDDKNSKKIFEDGAAIPTKPSRRCSSPAASEDTSNHFSTHDTKTSLSGTLSDPGPGLVKSFPVREFEPLLESPEIQVEATDQKDSQRLNSIVEKMDSQFVILKEGIKSFGESVREREKPKVFVAHSKFIVLSAHKLVYVGDGASRSLTNAKVQKKISTVTNSLSEVINDFVESIKIAARQYPEETAMNVMIKSAAKVTEKALELYKVLTDHAES